MSNEVALALLKKLGKAFNAGDVEAILECVTDDFEWILAAGPDAPHGKNIRGRDAVAAALAERARDIPELRFSETQVMYAGDHVIGTYRATGRYADGRRIDARGCDVYVIRDGKIARKDSYWKQIIDSTAAAAAVNAN
jgi:ketosteroid isomerase-like protein